MAHKLKPYLLFLVFGVLMFFTGNIYASEFGAEDENSFTIKYHADDTEETVGETSVVYGTDTATLT